MNPATLSVRDNPVWAALTTGNRAIAEGGRLARRYPATVAPFGAIADRSEAAFADLAGLVPPDGRVALVTPDKLAAVDSLVIEMQAPIHQMILDTPIARVPPGPGHVELGKSHIAAMLDLTGRTRPGPFGPRTIELGLYIGIRVDGVLAAMVGERMRCDGFVEISAVCVDPAHRGKGYAAALAARLAERIRNQGQTPFLHVFADNSSAIALYEKLGFTLSRRLMVTAFRRPQDQLAAVSPQNQAAPAAA